MLENRRIADIKKEKRDMENYENGFDRRNYISTARNSTNRHISLLVVIKKLDQKVPRDFVYCRGVYIARSSRRSLTGSGSVYTSSDIIAEITLISNEMEKIGAKGSNSYVAKRSKQVVRCQMEKSCDNSDIKNTLAIKLSEMKALHETILDDQNRLTQENVKLTEELNKLKEENTQAIAMKNKDIEELKKQIAKHCEKLERDVDQVELLVKRNKELESKNREILERDNELNKQLSELQERLATKEKIIRMKTILVQTKQKDVTILKEKTEQLLHIYENSMKDKLRNISDMCTEICNQSTSSSAQDNGDEEETSV